MRIKLFYVLWICLVFYPLMSQDCPTGGISFSSQSSLDAFIEMFPNCTELQGQLGLFGAAITNLHGLRRIKKSTVLYRSLAVIP